MSSNTTPSQPVGFDRERIGAAIAPIARAHGGEVVAIEFRSEKSGWVLRVFVERLGAAENALSTAEAAVDLDMCAAISRDLAPVLDELDAIEHAYNLEVGSPGVERELYGERDFVRFAGEKAKFKLREPVAAGKVITGLMGPVEDGKLTITDSGRTIRVPLENIVSSRLVFEFGTKSKPGKKKSKSRG